ncbi:MAG TPA: FoF1 ATP synthase subunit a [Feifaniaceae bacterium]|nr:FoF1 ATP synthase subunit a [Feifaniaceae bacterium]
MQTPTLFQIIAMAVCLTGGVAAFYARGKAVLPDPEAADYKKAKKKRRNLMLLGAVLLWVLSGLVMGLFMDGHAEKLTVSIMADRVDILGVSVSTSVLFSWIVIVLVLVLCVLARLFVIPKFTEAPKGLQAALETAVSSVDNFVEEKFFHKNDALSDYMFSLATLFIGSAFIELFGLRPPTADLVMTLSFALITFVMINYYGFKKKGFSGRIKSIAQPNAAILPIRVLTDIAIPVSLACRLFGNTLGGMIVMHLVYMALGAFSGGIPAVLGIYFSAFHPLIQVFIFVNLSLTFIGEAVE